MIGKAFFCSIAMAPLLIRFTRLLAKANRYSLPLVLSRTEEQVMATASLKVGKIDLFRRVSGSPLPGRARLRAWAPLRCPGCNAEREGSACHRRGSVRRADKTLRHGIDVLWVGRAPP
jgi:hypothetical protein